MAHTGRGRFFRWFERIPLQWISILVGVLCGLLVWLVLDPIQSRALSEIFQGELELQLDRRARDSRYRFEQYLRQWQIAAHGLSQHWRLVNHVQLPDWESRQLYPKTYIESQPAWLEMGHPMVGSVAPSQVVLLDAKDRVREIFHQQDTPFPVARAAKGYSGRDGAVVTNVWQAPYLIAWATIDDPHGRKRAVLMLVIPIDEQFLLESQQAVTDDGSVVGLLDADRQVLLSSSDEKRVLRNSKLSQWEDNYLVTSQSFTAYEGSDQNIQFATLISRKRVEQTSQRILASERRERLLEAAAFVAVFSLLFFFVSARLNHFLHRISILGRRALNIEQPVQDRGNQLLVLEAWIQDYFQRVGAAQDEVQREHETQIHDSEVLKSTLLDTALDSIITVDSAAKVVEVNATAERTFGFERDHLLGQSITQQLIHTDDRARFRKLLEACRSLPKGASACSPEGFLATDVNGVEKPVECSAVPIYMHEQRLFTLYLRDVSERRKAEREIQSLAKFTSENPSPVLRINNRGVITYANAASEPLLDYWGCELAQTLPLYWRNLVLETLEVGHNREYELASDGQIFSLLLAPIVELGYVNIYGRDITQVRSAEQQSRQHQSELVHVCRVSTMGEMATGLAHELNQPLAAIVNFASGCVRRLQAGIGGEAELVDAMAQITVQAERAGEIIKRLRSLVGKKPHEQILVNLNELVIEVASFVEYEANKRSVEIILDLAGEGLPVKVDLVQIEQVLLNLVRNAIQVLQQVEVSQRRLTLVTCRLDERQVEIQVRDTGPGISPDIMEHLFDAFFSTKESGMGMGLAISRKIIEDHQGDIFVTTELGHGTEFTVILPTDPKLELPGY